MKNKYTVFAVIALAAYLIVCIVAIGVILQTGELYVETFEPCEAFEVVIEKIPAEETETPIITDFYSDAIPLSIEEQRALYDASNEFGVDYFVMLGLIERETNFRNVYGDGGNSYGYCQIQPKWWRELMNEIGTRNLNVPKDNFRTACAIVSELTDKYGSLSGALTAYNKGSYDGTVSKYAVAVLQNAEKWRGI
jgi:soluble lytic murein transglycosylase-like protein